jgi:GTP cyclohydrolase I
VRLLLRAAGVRPNLSAAQTKQNLVMAAPGAQSPQVRAVADTVQELYDLVLRGVKRSVHPDAAVAYAQHLIQQTRGQAMSLPEILAKHEHTMPYGAGAAPVAAALQAVRDCSSRLCCHSASAPVIADPPSPGSSSTGLDVDEGLLGRCRMDGVSDVDSEGAASNAASAWEPSAGDRVRHRALDCQGAVLGPGGPGVLHAWRVTFASQCEHHMLPFYGTVHVAVLAAGSTAPVSACLAQDLVDLYACRLQVQERITHQVAGAFHEACSGAPVLVMCNSAHMCMVVRGVEKHASATMTTTACGVAASDCALRHRMLESLLDTVDDEEI